MRDSIDRLENIKARYPRLDIRSDTGWLIAEVERLRQERTDVIEELARRYRGMFANPKSEPATTAVFREAQQLADRRMRRALNDV
jgi:hypothetical protein